jgi:predicted nucleotidyltransferase
MIDVDGVLFSWAKEAPLERARELIAPYAKRADVIGVYVIGSATRPYRDALSDYDLEVIVEDHAYGSIPPEERLVYAIDEGPPRRVDHEFYLRPLSELRELVDSAHDVFHGPYQHAVVLHDPQGILAPIIARLAELPREIRDARCRIHYLEVYEALGRARKTLQRDSRANLSLLLGNAQRALVKLQFLQDRLWPMPWHWAEQELALVGAPAEPREAMATAVAAPSVDTVAAALEAVNEWLTAAGETFHGDVRGLFDWLYLTPEGKRVHHRWAAK